MYGHKELRYPSFAFMLDTVVEWIARCRFVHRVCEELGQCSPEDLAQIAKDLGVSVGDLRGLSAKGSSTANAAHKMLSMLSKQDAAECDPAIKRDLERTCALCDQKRRCQWELAGGTAAKNFRKFCPNAFTFDALVKREEQPQGSLMLHSKGKPATYCEINERQT